MRWRCRSCRPASGSSLAACSRRARQNSCQRQKAQPAPHQLIPHPWQQGRFPAAQALGHPPWVAPTRQHCSGTVPSMLTGPLCYTQKQQRFYSSVTHSDTWLDLLPTAQYNLSMIAWLGLIALHSLICTAKIRHAAEVGASLCAGCPHFNCPFCMLSGVWLASHAQDMLQTAMAAQQAAGGRRSRATPRAGCL